MNTAINRLLIFSYICDTLNLLIARKKKTAATALRIGKILRKQKNDGSTKLLVTV